MKNILFDLDGTLTDSGEGITRSIQYALAKLNQPIPEADQLLWCIGPPLSSSFKTLVDANRPDLAPKALALYRERFNRVGKFENRLYPKIPELLEELASRGCSLYVATSKPTVFARQITDHFNLAPYFNEVFGSRLNDELFEKAALIRHILGQKALSVKETAMVSDRKYDIAGAQKCCVTAIGVTYGYGSVNEIEAAGPDAVADCPLAVGSVLERVRSQLSGDGCELTSGRIFSTAPP